MIPATEHASGAWIGARKLGRRGGRVVYRVDPTAAPRPGSLRGSRLVARLRGPGGRSSASRATTARAAWILSKYGTYRDPGQSAAVDAAVLHLLAGGSFRLSRREASDRLRGTGQEDRVRSLAATMIRDSRRLAGPYRVVPAQVGETVVGDDVQIAMAAVVGRSGRPLRSVPVEVSVASGRWRAVGDTDTTGRAAYSISGLAAGPHLIDVRVRRLPETRLMLMQPSRSRASRDVVAGRKRSVVVGMRAIVQAAPRLSVSTRRIVRGERTAGRLGVVGAYGRTPRQATALLHGPFGSREQATCQRKRMRVRHTTVTGNGAVDLPRTSLQRAGFYVWYVGLPGDDYNRQVSVCAGIFRVAQR